MPGFNPFKSKPPVQQPNRNAFDLSFANNLTMKFGTLYPVFCKEVLNGDTFKIKPTFGLRFMPMAFPVQTRMRADLHFFYIRNRNLWKNYKKFYGMTDTDVVPPYVHITPDKIEMLKTGSLADYLGVPTTVIHDVAQEQYFQSTAGVDYEDLRDKSPHTFPLYDVNGSTKTPAKGWYPLYVNPDFMSANTDNLFTWNTKQQPVNSKPYLSLTQTGYFVVGTTPCIGDIQDESVLTCYSSDAATLAGMKCYIALFRRLPRSTDVKVGDWFTFMFSSIDNSLTPSVSSDGNSVTYKLENCKGVTRYGNKMTIQEVMKRTDDLQNLYVVLMFVGTSKDLSCMPTGFSISQMSGTKQSEAQDIKNPFVDYGSGAAQPLSALPFRAYESIYNGFYRNTIVNPFTLNGKPEYDVFCTTQEDGADETPYQLYTRNWEQDFLTTAVPSPQQGTAPLVGAQQRGAKQRFQLSTTVNGQKTNYYVNTDKVGDEQLLTGITGYDKNAPESTIQALNEAIQYGISINDFRNVNALQRWLEKNVRRGYRYKDQVLSHFGVELKYEECDMPEYIGGVSEDVNVQTIHQTAETNEQPLGAFAGNATCVGSSKHEIDHYCDEEGFIIGILSISPIPVYSQLLPKMFTKVNNALDYFKPEFGHIGLQPITYREVCPLQAFSEGKSLDSTFGYQRAWYDYLASTDEVHGDFRDTLQDFLVDRVFGAAPTLGKDFVEINHDTINDVFADTTNNDKIVGQIYFDVTAIRPIPKFGEPRLE